MRATWTAAAAAATCLACSTAQLDGGPGSPVRLDAPDAVGWEPEGPFPLELSVYNASGHRLVLAQPRAEYLEVKVLRASDGTVACRTPSATHVTVEGREARYVLASQALRTTVDLWPYCRNVGPGIYRYELRYVANPASASDVVFTGTLGPRNGGIAIGAGLSGDEAALAAALAGAPAPVQIATVPAGQPGAGSAAQPAAAAPAAQPSQSADEIRACLDRELAARGLNAYGDPQGTTYPAGPPADEGGRVLFVAGRNAEIRAACRISGM